MKKKLIILSSFVLGLAPVMALAQITITGTQSLCGALGAGSGTAPTLETLLCRVGALMNSVIPFLIALGVLYIVWGIVQYVIGGDEEAKKTGRDKMVYGIIGLAVVIGLWGLVRLVQNTFGLNQTIPAVLPTVPIVLPTPS